MRGLEGRWLLAELSAECSAERSAKYSAELSAERSAVSSLGRSAGHCVERAAEHSVERSAEHSADRSAKSPDKALAQASQPKLRRYAWSFQATRRTKPFPRNREEQGG